VYGIAKYSSQADNLESSIVSLQSSFLESEFTTSKVATSLFSHYEFTTPKWLHLINPICGSPLKGYSTTIKHLVEVHLSGAILPTILLKESQLFPLEVHHSWVILPKTFRRVSSLLLGSSPLMG
jgi:hypothetical protein